MNTLELTCATICAPWAHVTGQPGGPRSVVAAMALASGRPLWKTPRTRQTASLQLVPAIGRAWALSILLLAFNCGVLCAGDESGAASAAIVPTAASGADSYPAASQPVGPKAAKAASPASRADAAGFTDISLQSGVAEAVQRNYQEHPNWWLSGLHLVDLDGDGKLDLFLSAHGTPGALALLGDGKGRFTVAAGKWPPTEIHLAYDADEDGLLDLTMTHGDGGGQWWRNCSQAGNLSFQPTGIIRGAARRQAIIDIQRDGKADWLHGSSSGIHFNIGDGKGGFVERGMIQIGPPARAERLCIPADIDGDGQVELLSEWGSYAAPQGLSRIYRFSYAQGKIQSTDITAEAGLPLSGVSIRGIGDVDQDGDLDLICLENKRLEIYLNDGRGKFRRADGALEGDGRGINYQSWGMAVVTDFDNDGIADIAANGRNFLKIYRGTGNGRFTYSNVRWGVKDVSAASVDDGLCFGDIDDDGDLDIIGYTAAGPRPRREVAVYRNDLPARNWLRVRPVGRPGNRGAAGAKIRIYQAGAGDQPEAKRLLWFEQVTIFDSQAVASYYALAETERHFGLGNHSRVDVAVEFYPSGKTVWRKDVPANTVVRVEE